MIWLIVIVSVLIAVLCFIALTPLVIEINSNKRIYEVRLTGIAKLSVWFNNSTVLLNLQVLGWKKTFNPFAPDGEKTVQGIKSSSRKGKKRLQLFTRGPGRKIKNIITSFRIKHFYLDADTGDELLNAWLYPAAGYLNAKQMPVSINYKGRVALELKLTNNIARIIMAIIK